MTSLRFHSLDFDYQGTLPAEANAGNQFYGRDVAEFINSGLEARQYQSSAFDEDWGWMVSCSLADDEVLEVAIYNINDHGEGGRPGAPHWGLWLRHYRTVKRLGFLRSRQESPPSREHVAMLEQIFATRGIRLEPWDDGPG